MLKRWLYGMRKAASGWEDDYARRLVEDGFQRGRAASTIFYHPKTQVRVVVHGDDFTFAGTESELKKIEAKMHEWYDVKVRGILGSGKRDVQEIEILGRNLTWTEEGFGVRGQRQASSSIAGRLGVEWGVEGGQQYSRETREDWSRRGHGDAGHVGSEEIQKFGGDVELHELGQVRCTIRREEAVGKG